MTPEVLDFLTSPAAWGGSALPVERVDTHLSWLFLCGDEVLKLKQPRRFAQQDLRSVDARRRNCEAELELNRRFAPDTYLACTPLCRTSQGTLRLGPPGEPIDWLVRMRRLPVDRFLDRRIAARDVDLALLRRALRPIAHHLRHAPSAIPDPATWLRRLDAVLDTVARDLTGPDGPPPLPSRMRQWMHAHAALFERRVLEGRIVDGHGDLRPEHVCLSPEPAVIDCLEFDRDLRITDGLDEFGFLALECEELGAPEVADVVLDVWRAVDDFPAPLLGFHQALRALRRASVAAMRWRGPGGTEAQHRKCVRYLAVAAARAPPPR